MSKAARNILSLNHDEAMDFFMKSEQYHGFELPEYFSFDEVLKYVREKVRTISYEECLKKGVSPDSLSDVNLDILLNKDGRYAVRPIILANPFLYYCLRSSMSLISHLVQFQSSLTRKSHSIRQRLSTIGGIVWSNVPLNCHWNIVICL